VVGDLSVLSLPWLLPALLIQVALTLGLAQLLAAIQVFFRDVPQALGLLLSAWFFLTPIVYPLSMVPPRFAALLQWNPLTPLVGIYRAAFLGGPPGSPWALALLALLAAVLWWLGTWVFGRLRMRFVDEI
jgi:lipopolysaccharide transport system permease protein